MGSQRRKKPMARRATRNYALWTQVAFGDVVRKVNDKVDPWESDLERYVAGEHLDTDDLQIRRWGLIGDDYLGPAFHMRFKPGHVLYGSRRTYLRKIALAEFEGITANTTYVLESKDPKTFIPELLPFIMQTEEFHAHSILRSKGSVNPYVNYPDIACFEFQLPPRQEQIKLLGVLQAAEATYQSLRSLQAAARTATTSLLDLIFNPVATREIMKSKTKALPTEWTNLGSIAPLQVGFPFKSNDYSETGDRLLRGSNVAVDSTSWATEETRYWPTGLREDYCDYILHDDDLVIAMDRPFITGGFKVARLTRSDLPALLLQRVGRFLADDRPTRDLVWAYLHSRAFQYQMLSQQEGTDLPHISKAQIEGVLVHRGALSLSEEIGRFTEAWRQSVSLKRRLQEAVKMKRTVIQAALA